MNSITQYLFRKLIPRKCALCTQYHDGDDAICQDCFSFFTPNVYACTYCALPLPSGTFLTCGRCIQQKPYFDATIAPFIFEEPLRTLVHEFKYHQGLYLLSFLAKLILHHLPESALNTECLIPVPMHIDRLRLRGFNQSAELTKYIAKHTNIPCQLDTCKKIKPTLPQAGLNATERRRNLSHAFEVSSLPYQSVTLIDDLLTTGSTANELAYLLKQHGVAHVSVWCCARVTEDNHRVLSTINLSR